MHPEWRGRRNGPETPGEQSFGRIRVTPREAQVCNETYWSASAMAQRALSPEGGIRISCRVAFPAVFFPDGEDVKLVLLCIDVAADAHHMIFVPLQRACIR